MEKQINIFGEEIGIDLLEKDVKNKTKSFNTIFRDKYGYDKRHRCNECKHLVQHIANTTMYCKCEMKGNNSPNQSGTDYSCNLLELEQNNCSVCKQPIGEYDCYHKWDIGQNEEPICESCWNDEGI